MTEGKKKPTSSLTCRGAKWETKKPKDYPRNGNPLAKGL